MNGKHLIAMALTISAISSVTTVLVLNLRDANAPATSSPADQAAGLPAASLQAQAENNRLMNDLLHQMETLRGQVSQLEHQRPQAPTPKQAASFQDDTAEAEPQLSAEALIKKREDLAKAHKELFENNLQQEKKDKQWVKSAQAKLGVAYSAASDKGIRFIDADCRSTLCKVQMVLDQPGKAG